MALLESINVPSSMRLVEQGADTLVDGDNVTNAHYPELTLDDRWDRLTQQVSSLAARTDAELTIVFNGEGVGLLPSPPSLGVRLLFGYSDGQGRSVEDLIVAMVAAESDGRPAVVVTSDRALAVLARQRGAHSVPSAALLGLVERMQP